MADAPSNSAYGKPRDLCSELLGRSSAKLEREVDQRETKHTGVAEAKPRVQKRNTRFWDRTTFCPQGKNLERG